MKRKVRQLLASLLIVTTCFSIIGTNTHAAETGALVEVQTEEVAIEETETLIKEEELNEETELVEEKNASAGWDGITTEAIYETENYKVTFKLTGYWDDGYNANVRIDNMSENPIENWIMQVDYNGDISNIWNAVVDSQEEGKYVIKNAGWNQDIAAGSYVEFGLSGQENFNGFPIAYEMLGGKTETKEEDYTVEYKIQSDWKTGFGALIVITNNTEEPIEDWILEFDGENEISQIWNGVIESHEENHYVVKNAGYNQNIAPNESVSFGFNVSNGSSANEFSNFVLSKYSDEVVEEPEEEPEVQREREPLESIGEAYCKEPEAEDIIIDEESGIQYIKNQLLVSAYMGAEKSIFEEIAEEVGAEIVGYIELTNDYQFEFLEEKTMEEMQTIAEYIDGYSFVSSVTLNYSENTASLTTTSNDALYNDGKTCYTHKNMYDTDGDTEGDKDGTDFEEVEDVWDEENPSGDNWGLETLNVLSIWDYKDTFETVKVGVYDKGFGEHEDLVFDDIVNNTTNKEDQDHGTHVAGTIAALHDNKKGISGVATDTRLYAYATGGREYGSTMGNKIAYATLIGNHVKVINVSMGWKDLALQYAASHGNEKAQKYIQSTADALEEYLNKLVAAGYDFVICVAAGNTNNDIFVADIFKTYGFRVATEKEKANTNIKKVSGGVLAKYGYNLTAIDDVNLKKRIIVVGAMRNNGTQNYTVAYFSNIGERVDFVAPGVNILSTVPEYTDPTGYMLKEGTSMACPHVAGLAALMFQVDPTIKASNIKGYMSLSSTKTISDGTYTYKIPNAVGCYEYADHITSSGTTDTTFPTGIVCGYTVNVFNSSIADVKITAIRKSTGEYNLGQYSFTFESDSEGYYMEALPQGTYDFMVSKDGYLPHVLQNIVVNADDTLYVENIILGKWASSTYINNAVRGTIKDALKGTAVSGATVKLRKGWNNKTGAYVKDSDGKIRTAISTSSGTFSINISVGAYTAEITKNGYVTGYYNLVSADTQNAPSLSQSTVVLTPVLSDDEYRIVLTWGDSPRDLDSHLTYYVEDKQKLHVYFSNKTGNYNGKKIAQLDLDDTTSYGPETVTITLDASLIESGGEFRYSVHDYSNKSSFASDALSLSNATIRVYGGNALLETFYVPKDQIGTVWHVFDITEDGIKVVNEFYNCSSAGGVK